MASKLLNVLNEIEQGRKDCISVLHEKGLRAPDDASFLEISELMDKLNWHVYNEDPTAPPNQIGNPWGYTATTDPEVWKKPTDWPDIESIFKTFDAVTITLNNDTNVTLIPVMILLLKNDSNDTIRVRWGDINGSAPEYGYNKSDLQAGDLVVYGGRESYTGRWYSESRVCFSDTNEYIQFEPDFNATTTNPQPTELIENHTWDQSKDIIIGEDHYRWVVLYVGRGTNTTFSFSCDTTQLNVVEAIYTDPLSLNYFNAGFSLEHIKRIKQFGSDLRAFNHSTISINDQNANNTNLYRKNHLCCFEDDLNDRVNANNKGLYYQTYWPYLTKLILKNYVYTDQTNAGSSYDVFAPQSYAPKLYYIEIKKYTLFTLYGNNSYAYNYNRYAGPQPPSPLKYLICNEEEQATQTLITRFPSWPNIVETNAFDWVTTIKSAQTSNNYGCTGIYGIRKGVLSLPRLTTIEDGYFFARTKVHTLLLPAFKGNSSSIITGSEGSNIRKLLLGYTDSYTSLATTLWCFPDLRVYELPYLTVLDNTLLVTNSTQSYACSPIYIDLSALESMSASTNLNQVGIGFINLKQDFKFDINLSSVSTLDYNCVIDLFNKCAQLEEGESYTITIPGHIKARITPEEIAIATNKGWTVN